MRIASALGIAALVTACTTDPVTIGDAGADDDAAIAADAGRAPTDAGAIRTTPMFPTAAGTCPDMTRSGTVMFAPAGLPPRPVQIWVSDAAATMDGPLVLVWHGAGGSPSEAAYILGDALQAIVDAGGIVAAPAHDPVNTQLPWFLDTGTREDDLFVADEVVGCAHTSVGFDPRHLHVVGFSAGALHTTQMSFRRASYIASVVTYSGGLLSTRPPTRDAPDARFAAMILHGGASDVVVVNFQTTSTSYLRAMQSAGDFGFICNHGMGHTVPAAARASAWAFLEAHPFGQLPRAYANGLPSDFYSYCALP